MKIADFINEISGSNSYEDVWSLFTSYIAQFEIRHIIYSYRITPNKRFDPLRRINHKTVAAVVNNIEIRSTAPMEAAEDYVKKRLYEIDPMDIFLSQGDIAPKYYHAEMLPKDHEKRANLDKFHSVIKSHGVQSGIYIPVINMHQHLPGGVGLYSPLPLASFNNSVEDRFSDMVLAAHYMDRHFRMRLHKEEAKDIGLSKDQHEIMNLVTKGYGNNDICDRLNLKMPTVSYHLRVIRDKLHASHNREIPIAAIRAGLVDP